MDNCIPCPGQYCGRPFQQAQNLSSCLDILTCGGCPWGYRTDLYFCRPCREDIELYDWLYLGFMALLIPVLHFHVIDYFHCNNKRVWLLHAAAFCEAVLSFGAMILLSEPRGRFEIYSCGVSSIKDWYTLFFNPKKDYVQLTHCTQEAVFPLYTSLFIYFLFCLIMMAIVRGIIIRVWLKSFGRPSYYAGLYLLPIVTLLHACLAGLLYYCFPYLLLLGSAIGVAVFLTVINSEYNFYKNLRQPRSIVVVLCYCLAHGYGIISITRFEEPIRDGPLLLLVFFPLAYYAISMPFTAADNFKS